MTNVTIDRLDRGIWEGAISRFQDHNYRQIWDFGLACARRVNAESEHVAVKWGGEILGLADVRIKRIPIVKTGIAYINGGPLVRQGTGLDRDRLRSCLCALTREYVGKRGLVLRVLGPCGSPDWNEEQGKVFSENGFVQAKGGRPYRTFQLDIARPVEDIRKTLAQKWRNCLNQAEKQQYTIRSGTDPHLFEQFCALFSQFIERKRFVVELTPPIYHEAHTQMSEKERFQISLVEVEGTVVAGHVASLLGDTCVYLLGASSEDGLRVKASYLLQWHVVNLAHERGFKWYDLGGIDPEGNPGVYNFKKGLGGKDVTGPWVYELDPSRLKRAMVLWGEKVNRLWRRFL